MHMHVLNIAKYQVQNLEHILAAHGSGWSEGGKKMVRIDLMEPKLLPCWFFFSCYHFPVFVRTLIYLAYVKL